MDLGFGQMMAVVGALHKGVGMPVVRARLKYFQRIRFPPSEDIFVGSGERARYDTTSLMRLVLAFELLAAGVAPQQAVALMEGGWPLAERLLARAWSGRDDPGDFVPVLLTARVAGLEAKRDGSGKLEEMTEAGLWIWIKAREREDRRLLVLELVQVAKALEAALGDCLKLGPLSRMHAALNAWSVARREQAQPAYGT